MGVENWSDDVVLVSLSDAVDFGEELADVAGCICRGYDRDVVVDCSGLERMDCTCRRWLLEMSDTLTACGHRVVLCGSRAKLEQTLAAPALTATMGFASDRFTALAGLGLA